MSYILVGAGGPRPATAGGGSAAGSGLNFGSPQQSAAGRGPPRAPVRPGSGHHVPANMCPVQMLEDLREA
jgi:hypothetical protein